MGDVVVVGAGMGGLAAATALAAHGLEVDVLEAGEHPGGKMGIVTVDGVEADTGPSVLTLPPVLDRVLRLAGTRLGDEVELRAPEPSFRYLYPDRVALDVFPDLGRTLASVEAALGPAACDELAAFLTYARGIWEAAAPHFVLGPAPTLASLARGGLASLALLHRIDPLRTMWGALRARVHSPHLRALLARYATYNGSDVRRAPATLHCIAHVELALGGFGVRGGMHQVARALERAAERTGVRLHLGARVERIRLRHGRVEGVETADGRGWRAATVVANADAAHLFATLLPPETRPRRMPWGEPSMSGWTALLRARRRVGAEARVAHTVLFPRRPYLEEFTDIFDRGRPPAEPTVYLCAQEACHDRRGWAREEPVFVMANAPAGPPAADGRGALTPWEELREAVLRRLDEAGLRDPGDELVWERTPAELAARFPGSRGSLYGAASNGPLAAFRRPPNRVTGVRGLYLASGSAHPGGGVPLALLSGLAAARALLEDRGFRPAGPFLSGETP